MLILDSRTSAIIGLTGDHVTNAMKVNKIGSEITAMIQFRNHFNLPDGTAAMHGDKLCERY